MTSKETQYVGGVNQAVFPSGNIRIDSLVSIPSTTGVDVTYGDGADPDRYVAATALSTYMDQVLAKRHHDGTNRKLTIGLSGNFTGTIKTTLKYTILE